MHLEEFRIGTLDDFVKNGRKAQERGEHTYTCNCFMLMCGRNYHNIVKQPDSLPLSDFWLKADMRGPCLRFGRQRGGCSHRSQKLVQLILMTPRVGTTSPLPSASGPAHLPATGTADQPWPQAPHQGRHQPRVQGHPVLEASSTGCASSPGGSYLTTQARHEKKRDGFTSLVSRA